jgi:hypothetical protein
MSNKPHKIEPPYVQHRRAMMESAAWRSLGLSARRILDGLEIEHMKKSGKHNGRLICPYKDFVNYGIRRKSIAPAIRQLCRCGLLEITQPGRWAHGGKNFATYRLTYLPTTTAAPTDEWREAKPPVRHGLNSKRAKTRNRRTSNDRVHID